MKGVKIEFNIPSFTKQTEELVDAASFSLVEDVAQIVKREIQEHIPPPTRSWKSSTDGALATGELKNSIQYEITKTGNTYSATIGPVGSGQLAIKAAVHSSGKTIRAKKKPYMTFQTPNGWVSLKQYTITPKGYMLAGWSKARRELARYA